jgi:hypothetical protein
MTASLAFHFLFCFALMLFSSFHWLISLKSTCIRNGQHREKSKWDTSINIKPIGRKGLFYFLRVAFSSMNRHFLSQLSEYWWNFVVLTVLKITWEYAPFATADLCRDHLTTWANPALRNSHYFFRRLRTNSGATQKVETCSI